MFYKLKYWFGILQKIGIKIQGDILFYFILEYSPKTAFRMWPFVVPRESVFLQRVPFSFPAHQSRTWFSYQIKINCMFSLQMEMPFEYFRNGMCTTNKQSRNTEVEILQSLVVLPWDNYSYWFGK